MYDRETALQTLFGQNPQHDSSMNDIESEEQITTERMTEHNPDVELEVFTDGASAHDIVQGGNGTCFYLGGLMCVAEHQKFIKKLVVHYSVELGVYGIMFYSNEWTYVIIDDYNVYCSGERVFSGSVDQKEIWVSLLEKAYAKLHGSYDMVDGGFGTDAIIDLTGGIPVEVDKNNWEEFHDAVQSGYYCFACFLCNVEGTDKEQTEEGLIPGHIYSVLNTLEYDDVRLVNVRNPHGGGEWQGDYCDGSDLWTDELKEAAGHQDEEDGSFWMTHDDFVTWFGLESVRLFDKDYHFTKLWGESCCDFSRDSEEETEKYDNIYSEGYFLLTLHDSADVAFCLSQTDMKKQPDWDTKRNDLFALGFTVLKFEEDAEDIIGAYCAGEFEVVLDTKDLADSRDVALADILQPGNYALIPRFDFAGCQYSVRAFTNAGSYDFEYYFPDEDVRDEVDEEDGEDEGGEGEGDAEDEVSEDEE